MRRGSSGSWQVSAPLVCLISFVQDRDMSHWASPGDAVLRVLFRSLASLSHLELDIQYIQPVPNMLVRKSCLGKLE